MENNIQEQFTSDFTLPSLFNTKRTDKLNCRKIGGKYLHKKRKKSQNLNTPITPGCCMCKSGYNSKKKVTKSDWKHKNLYG